MPSWKKWMLPLPSYEVVAHMLHKVRNQSIGLAHVRSFLASMYTNGLAADHRLCKQLVAVLVEVENAQHSLHFFENAVLQEVSLPLILDYLQCGEPQHAFTLHEIVQGFGSVRITKHAYKALLKACTDLKDLKRGLEVHAEIARMAFLENDIFVGNMLVALYLKCGLLTIAHEVFFMLPVRDVVSWNALISGLADNGLSEEALNLYGKMLVENVFPDVVTFVSCLKACGCCKALAEGCAIHSEAERKGLLTENPVLGTALVAMYIKCDLLERAQETFDRITIQDAILWTTLITGYADCGQGDKALQCFGSMQHQGVPPDDISYLCSLKACGSIQNIRKGRELHIDMQMKGILDGNVGIGNALLDMYCKCGAIDAAQQVFDKIPAKDVVSWNTLITGFTEQGYDGDAIACFEKLQHAGVCPSAVTFVSSLQACGNIKAAEKGGEMHAWTIKNGLLELDVVIGTVLVEMYGKCGMLAEAQKVFDELPTQNVFTWNALISAYTEHGHDQKVLSCLFRMQLDAVDPNISTFVWGLKACGCLRALERGEVIHAEIKRMSNLETDLIIGSVLVDMYAKCGCLIKAQQLFDKLPARNVVAWTALIAGYAEHGCGQKALNLYHQMQLEAVTPNSITLVSTLKACISIGGIEEGKEVLDHIARKGLLEEEPFVGNAVVDAYSKCGSFAKAQEVFDQLPVRDVISWNILIAGYIEHDHDEDALECFKRMQWEGVGPDKVTYLCSLKSCGKTGALDLGQESHIEIERIGLRDSDVTVGSALVDMYAKCGLLKKAQEILDNLPIRNVVSWNALISGFAQLGESRNVFYFFDKMLRDGLRPDCITFVNVLSACNLTGMCDTSQTCFEVMSKEYGVAPVLEHYGCVLDLLGRAGEVDKAEVLVRRMPIHPNAVVWHSLLGACRKWGNTKLAKQAFESAICLDENDGASYALIHDIYAGADK
ncbi:hypothetical protein GOP47_0007855 [Adiantum capillus-veneris]|uniref:Pentatricopeptide repeat-containing protein n=1 Tax=Adiantum capillus-veneris TaxID=13818 RepID=A0A9D4V1I2_ADICA|nr:hypothetical protein GOP47_0007855 [Adiantum capillus-veneris]